MVLVLVGLFNVFGIYIVGWFGGCWLKLCLLIVLYLVCGVVIVLFFWLLLSVYSVYVFGVVMGLLWLFMVFLINGIVVILFGVCNLLMFGGIVFFFY